jgi:hypothetical protein
MEHTRHADARMRQRGFKSGVASLICQFGVSLPAKRGAVRKFIKKRDVEWIRHEVPECKQLLDKAVGRYLVMTKDESTIITAY